jgi:AcrR family transcriptional regulator
MKTLTPTTRATSPTAEPGTAGTAGTAGAAATGEPGGDARRAGRPRDARASRAITEAALRQLTDVGYAHMSMESVAAEAKVARATIYRRYEDKADLVTSAIATGVEPPATTGDPLYDLVAFLEEFDARDAGSCLEVVGNLLGARSDPRALHLHRERVVGPRRQALVAITRRARGEGLLREDADLELLVEMLVGAVFARRVIGVPKDAGWARRAVEAACAGVATPRGLTVLRRVRRRGPGLRP